MSVLNGLILEKIYELFVGTNETVRNIRVPVSSGCPWSGIPLYYYLVKFIEFVPTPTDVTKPTPVARKASNLFDYGKAGFT